MNPKTIKIVDTATQLMGSVVNKLAKMGKHNHVLDNLALLRSEIQGSKFAEANYYNLPEKIANVGLCRQHLEHDVKLMNKQIERLKLIESVLKKVADN